MVDDSNLFRIEAVDATRNRLGSPVNNRTTANWIIVAFMTALFATAVVFLFTARYSRKETVWGQVVPAEGVARVSPLRPGVVKSLWVRSGDKVKKNQKLFSISYDTVLESGTPLSLGINQSTEDQLTSNVLESDARKAQVAASQAETQAKLSGVLASIDSLVENRRIQIRRVQLLQRNVDSLEGLAEKQYISQFEMRAREDALLQAKQTLLQMDQKDADLKVQVSQLQAQLRSERHSLGEISAGMERSRAQIEERRLTNLSSQGGELVALADGQITGLQVKEGDLVLSNQTLAFIVPPNDKKLQEVNLWVPSRAVGFVQSGNKVRLMFDAFPYQTFGVGVGRVREISMAPVNPNELPIPIETKEQMYKVLVELDSNFIDGYGKSWSLKPGMRLSADIVLEEKSLIDWLMDPINAIRKRS